MRIEREIEENVRCDMTVDYYVPVTVEFPGNEDRYGMTELLYYRYLGKDSSFIEIAVNSKTMKITRAVIVSINGDVERLGHDFSWQQSPGVFVGNPEISLESFSDSDTFTETKEKEMKFKYFGRKLLVLLGGTVHEKVVMGSLSLLLDERKEVNGFLFEGFSENEWEVLKESCQIT